MTALLFSSGILEMAEKGCQKKTSAEGESEDEFGLTNLFNENTYESISGQLPGQTLEETGRYVTFLTLALVKLL